MSRAMVILFIGYAQTRLFHLAGDANGFYILCDPQPLWLQTWVYFLSEHLMLMSVVAAAMYVVDHAHVLIFLQQLFELEFFDLLDYVVFYNHAWWPGLDIQYNDIKLAVIFTLISYNLWILKPSSH